MYFGISSHNSKMISRPLDKFTEEMKSPDFYNMLDTTKWQKDEPIKSPMFTFCEEITVTETDSKKVDEITKILNNKDYDSLMKDELDKYYDNPKEDVRFWLACGADSDLADKYYFPYEIFICKDKSLYIHTGKGNEDRFLKSSLNDEEYGFIEGIYNYLYEIEH